MIVALRDKKKIEGGTIINIVPDDLSLEILQEHGGIIIGSFVSYLANYAHVYFNPSRALLSLNCADSYLSGVKSYYARQKFPDVHIPVFAEVRWKDLRKRFKSLIMIRIFQEGRGLVTSKPASTSDDAELMAYIALWKGTCSYRTGGTHR